MDQPILKLNWERFKAHVDLDINTASKLILPFTKVPIDQLTLLSEGCANTNYKVTFKHSLSPVVIRIYMRDKSALKTERVIHKLVASKIPVPSHLYADDRCSIYEYPYAIMEWIEGKLMREIILTKNEIAISACAYDAGKYLNELRNIKFIQGGFFSETNLSNSTLDNTLKIRPFNKEEEYTTYMFNILQDGIVKESLESHLHDEIFKLIKNYADLLPNVDEANLTHADYDPANIMVKEENGQWKIAAILDWEFAFAGTYLLDVGMMLRYSHRLPTYYENSFIAGIEENGQTLPRNWKKQAKLMDLLCLLQLIHYNPVSERPKLNRDVVSLISDIIKNWHSF